MDSTQHRHLSAARNASDHGDASDTVLTQWTVHLVAASPRKSWGVAGAAVAAGAFGSLALHSWVGGVLGAAFVACAAAEFLLPIRYILTDHAASSVYGLAHLEIPWSSVRRVVPLLDGVFLSPFADPSRLDAFRGVHLRFPSNDTGLSREQILTVVHRCVENAHSDR
jgi:hypothetical protein